ncbi:MAG: hypothetical protein Kow00128_06920 [Deltaproteobacteria bacterium]
MRKQAGKSWLPAITLLLVLAGCGGAGTAPEGSGPAASRGKTFALPAAPDPGLSREARRGKVLYAYYCALCHGMTGDADGFNAFNLRTPPTRHTDPILMGTLSDTQIHRIVREGGGALERSPEMPPWGGVLSDREIDDVTAFIRTLAVPPKSPES